MNAMINLHQPYKFKLIVSNWIHWSRQIRCKNSPFCGIVDGHIRWSISIALYGRMSISYQYVQSLQFLFERLWWTTRRSSISKHDYWTFILLLRCLLQKLPYQEALGQTQNKTLK